MPSGLSDIWLQLAADYCQHYDARYGNGLIGPSRTKIQELVRFLFTIEALKMSRDKPQYTSRKAVLWPLFTNTPLAGAACRGGVGEVLPGSPPSVHQMI